MYFVSPDSEGMLNQTFGARLYAPELRTWTKMSTQCPSIEEFVYEPLSDAASSIRLLKILPPGPEGMLAFSLQEVPLLSLGTRASPQFDALSYTWQPVEPRQPILIDGHRMTIGHNLHEFLSSIIKVGFPAFRGSPDSLIWADAVCINQTDKPEKSLQVNLMGQIYQTSQKTLVWLGPSDTHSDKVQELYNGGKTPTNSIEAWSSMASLCDRPYWNRMWIVQEICLSSKASGGTTFFFGTNHVQYFTFALLYENAVRYRPNTELRSPSPHMNPQIAESIARIKQSGMFQIFRSEAHGLSDLLRLHRNRSCEDPRDMVYALLGLARREQARMDLAGPGVMQPKRPTLMRPDYDKTEYSVFWDTIYACQTYFDFPLILFEILHLKFDIAEADLATTEHVFDDTAAQKERGLLCPCIRLQYTGKVSQLAKFTFPTNRDGKFTHLVVKADSSSPEQVIYGLAAGAVQVSDRVYRIAFTAVRIILRPQGQKMLYVGAAFTRQSDESFTESNNAGCAKLQLHHTSLGEMIPQALREIPPHLVKGENQWDIVLGRKSLLYFMSLDSRVMHRRWLGDEEVVPYSDPGLRAAYAARTVRVIKREGDAIDDSAAAAMTTLNLRGS